MLYIYIYIYIYIYVHHPKAYVARYVRPPKNFKQNQPPKNKNKNKKSNHKQFRHP
jgi:hypothetical protein